MRDAADGQTDIAACLFWIVSLTVIFRPFQSEVAFAISSPTFLGDWKQKKGGLKSIFFFQSLSQKRHLWTWLRIKMYLHSALIWQNKTNDTEHGNARHCSKNIFCRVLCPEMWPIRLTIIYWTIQLPIPGDSALNSHRERNLTFHKNRSLLSFYSITYKTQGAYFWSQRWCCAYFTTNTPQIHWKQIISTVAIEYHMAMLVNTHWHKNLLTDFHFTWIKLRRHIILLLNNFINF